MTECLRGAGGKAGKSADARSGGRILPWRGTVPGAGMRRSALSLLLALSACAASLPLPPSPPAEPALASAAPAPPQHIAPQHIAPQHITSQHITSQQITSQPGATEHARAGQPPAIGALTDKSAAASGFSPDTIAKAGRAMAQITKLNSLFAAEMASTSDPKIQGAIYADFQKKYMAAINAQGLTMSAYLQVLNAAAKDPGLSEELGAPNSSGAGKPAAATAPAAPQ